MPKKVNFGDFLKTWNLWSNSVTRQVSCYRAKIVGFSNISGDFQSNATFSYLKTASLHLHYLKLQSTMRWFSKNNDARSSNQFFNLVPIPWTTHCLAFLFRQMSHVKRKLFNSFFATLSSFQNNQKEMKWNGENQALFHTCKKPSHNLCFLVIIGTIFLLLCFS